MTISKNYKYIRSTIHQGVTLVAVSKYFPVEDIRQAYDAGARVFGENRPQELAAKQPVLPPDIQWHMIGHLQTNKIKYIAPFVSLIHSIDSLRLAEAVSKEGEKIGRVIPILLQVHVAKEETKYGFTPDELRFELETGTLQTLPGIQIQGLMAMASLTGDQQQIRSEFGVVKALFDTVKAHYIPSVTQLSMGMSSDYPIAIEAGATIVRIGSAIFGDRHY